MDVWNLTQDEILAQKRPTPQPMRGIYFLICDNEIVYVGQSTNLIARIYTHNRGDKIFDSCAILLCPDADLFELEAEYIVKFNPKYNGNLPPNSTWISLNELRVELKKMGIGGWRLRKFIENHQVSNVNGFYRIADFASLLGPKEQ